MALIYEIFEINSRLNVSGTIFFKVFKRHINRVLSDESLGVVVMGADSCSKGREFESQG